MITKAEIMEKAALKIDLSTFPAEALEKMNEIYLLPGKRRVVVLLIIESDFNASAQFTNLFVAVTIESTF